MEKIIKTSKDTKAAHTIVQEYAKIWAKKEVEFWQGLKEKIITDWESSYLTEDNDKSGIIDYKIIADSRNKKDDYFGLFFEKNKESLIFRCDVYAMNSDKYLIIDFAIQKNNEDIKIPETVYDIFKSIGFNKKRNNLPCAYLQQPIQFYGKNVSEPTFELFDKKEFDMLVENTKNEVLELLNRISKREEEILKATENES